MKVDGLEVKIYYERGPVEVLREEKMSRRGGIVTEEGFTGKTVAIIWDGEQRHVGISQCAMGDLRDPPKKHDVVVIVDGYKTNFTFTTGTPKDEFSRPQGRMVAINRALFAKVLADKSDPRVRLRPGYGKYYFSGTKETVMAQVQRDTLSAPDELFVRVERKPSNEAVQNPA